MNFCSKLLPSGGVDGNSGGKRVKKSGAAGKDAKKARKDTVVDDLRDLLLQQPARSKEDRDTAKALTSLASTAQLVALRETIDWLPRDSPHREALMAQVLKLVGCAQAPTHTTGDESDDTATAAGGAANAESDSDSEDFCFKYPAKSRVP